MSTRLFLKPIYGDHNKKNPKHIFQKTSPGSHKLIPVIQVEFRWIVVVLGLFCILLFDILI